MIDCELTLPPFEIKFVVKNELYTSPLLQALFYVRIHTLAEICKKSRANFYDTSLLYYICIRERPFPGLKHIKNFFIPDIKKILYCPRRSGPINFASRIIKHYTTGVLLTSWIKSTPLHRKKSSNELKQHACPIKHSYPARNQWTTTALLYRSRNQSMSPDK